MSFHAYARRVRDPAWPYRRRVSALRSCVQMYRPIGFHATLGFLREVAGPFERDEAALPRALGALVECRAGWLAELRRYDEQRRLQKRQGRRCPPPGDPNPTDGPLCWYGAVRPAALYALRYWRHNRLPALLRRRRLLGFRIVEDPLAVRVDACVTACLAAGGPLAEADRRDLAAVIVALRRRWNHDSHRADDRGWGRTRQLLLVAGFVRDAADAPDDSGPRPGVSPETG